MRIPHNKGKVKENYEPLRIVSVKVSETKKRQYKEGKIKTPIPKGSKRIDISGANHPLYGKHHNEKSKEKMRLARQGKNRSKDSRKKQSETMKETYKQGRSTQGFKKGHVGWNKGLTKETDERVKKYAKKLKGKEKTEEHLKKIFKFSKPNKPEKIMIGLIKDNNLPFNYVGNAKIWFKGPTHIFNPDFLSKNPKHIIELFGDYWHRNTKKKDKERLSTYSKYGYKTLVIWEHELKTPAQVVNKIKGFIKW